MSGGSSFLLHEDYYDILVLKKSYENFLSFHSKLGNFLNFSLSCSIASFPTTSLSRPPSPGPDAPRELCPAPGCLSVCVPGFPLALQQCSFPKADLCPPGTFVSSNGLRGTCSRHADTVVVALVTQRPGPGQLQPHHQQLPSTAETGAGVRPASPKVLVWPGRSSSRARAAKAPAGTGLLLAAAASGEGSNGSDSSHRGCCRSE